VLRGQIIFLSYIIIKRYHIASTNSTRTRWHTTAAPRFIIIIILGTFNKVYYIERGQKVYSLWVTQQWVKGGYSSYEEDWPGFLCRRIIIMIITTWTFSIIFYWNLQRLNHPRWNVAQHKIKETIKRIVRFFMGKNPTMRLISLRNCVCFCL
jgi:hypothetical protein